MQNVNKTRENSLNLEHSVSLVSVSYFGQNYHKVGKSSLAHMRGYMRGFVVLVMLCFLMSSCSDHLYLKLTPNSYYESFALNFDCSFLGAF